MAAVSFPAEHAAGSMVTTLYGELCVIWVLQSAQLASGFPRSSIHRPQIACSNALLPAKRLHLLDDVPL